MLCALRKIQLLGILAVCFAAASAQAELSGPRPWKWLFQVVGDFHYSQSDPDFVEGASYSQQFGTAVVASAALGLLLGKSIYFGLRYEYWYAQRKMSGAGGSQSDLLQFQGAGPEIGYRWGNPRLFWLATGALFYPVKLAVQSSLGFSYTTTSIPLCYQGRLTLGLRLNGLWTLIASGGYRFANLAGLQNASGSPLTSSASFDLSGPFAGLGFGLTF